jgi:quercetin dioxygenase-like cupin family protein
MKLHLIALFSIPAFLFPQDASLPTVGPVENEPLHKVMLKNDAVTVLHVLIPAGATTLYHSHVHDRVAVDLSVATIAQQKLGEAETTPAPTQPGSISALTLKDPSYTHRVHNTGTTPYEVLDIEPQTRPLNPSPDVAAAVAAENPSARVYNWNLAPGATSPMHTHMRPYVIISITALNLKMTSPDGESASHEVGAGDFRYIDGKITHNLSNLGTTPGQIVEVELK